MFYQYHCCEATCTYKTTATTETAADKQLEKDGGYDQDKKNKCPLCKKDSLVFIKKRKSHQNNGGEEYDK